MATTVEKRRAQKAADEQKMLADALEKLAQDMEKARAFDGQWYCIRASCGHSRRAQRSLAEQKFHAYLPMETRWIKHARRKIRGSRPLLGRYLFVKLATEEPAFHRMRGVDGVEALVGTGGNPRAIPESFVMDLWGDEVAGQYDATRPTKKDRPKFEEGDETVIRSGPLEGCGAIVLKVLSDRNVRILYTLFGRSGEATIEVTDLKRKAA